MSPIDFTSATLTAAFLIPLCLAASWWTRRHFSAAQTRKRCRAARRAAGRQWAERALKTMSPDHVARWVSVTDRTEFDQGIEDAVREHYEANPHLDH